LIVECRNVKIDTEKDHAVHKEAINAVTTMHCDKDKPRYWFTQIVDDEYRFYHLHYNRKGTKLKKIEYWNKIDRQVKKRVVKDKDSCYFEKKKLKKEYETITITETNYGDKCQSVWSGNFFSF
jgi:hypothetical protein